MLDAYRHFVWVVELGSFTAAARRAHLSQPALSASIRKLEEHLDAKLLHRLPRGARPTAAGLALLPRVEQALAALERGRQRVAEVEGLARGEVRIGGGATACTYYLPPVLAAFRHTHPGITVRLQEVFTTEVAQQVADGQLDLAIGTAHPDLPSETLLHDPLCVVAHPELAARWPDGLGAGAPVVAFPRGSSLRGLVDEAFPDVDIVMEVRSFGAVKGLARSGVGLALLSTRSVVADLESGRLVRIDEPRLPPPRPLMLVHPGEDQLPPAARALRLALLDRLHHHGEGLPVADDLEP